MSTNNKIYFGFASFLIISYIIFSIFFYQKRSLIIIGSFIFYWSFISFLTFYNEIYYQIYGKKLSKIEDIYKGIDIILKDINDFKYLNDKLKNNKKLVLIAVKNNESVLKYISTSLRNDKEFILEAVKNNGLALKFASVELQNDIDVAVEAVKENEEALSYVSRKVKKDKEFINIIDMYLK